MAMNQIDAPRFEKLSGSMNLLLFFGGGGGGGGGGIGGHTWVVHSADMQKKGGGLSKTDILQTIINSYMQVTGKAIWESVNLHIIIN